MGNFVLSIHGKIGNKGIPFGKILLFFWLFPVGIFFAVGSDIGWTFVVI